MGIHDGVDCDDDRGVWAWRDDRIDDGGLSQWIVSPLRLPIPSEAV